MCCVGHPCALSPVPGVGPGWGACANLRENALELLRLVVFEQLYPTARRKLGQLHFWVLSQHIGVAHLTAPLMGWEGKKMAPGALRESRAWPRCWGLLRVTSPHQAPHSAVLCSRPGDSGLPSICSDCAARDGNVRKNFVFSASKDAGGRVQPAWAAAMSGTYREPRAFGTSVCVVPGVTPCLCSYTTFHLQNWYLLAASSSYRAI